MMAFARIHTCKIPCTSQISPLPTSLVTVRSHVPNRNYVVTTATLVSVIFCFHNSILSCFILNEIFDMLQKQKAFCGYTNLHHTCKSKEIRAITCASKGACANWCSYTNLFRAWTAVCSVWRVWLFFNLCLVFPLLQAFRLGLAYPKLWDTPGAAH